MSLYLKYRPQDFNNLVGQGFIKETLQKAIADDKTIGAYLLCGPRGTGKTSTARIFAKTINCTDTKDGNPCLKCEICTSFLEERLVDIIEIDAASHTGVDNIREIIEKAQFSPTKTKYKIYIIDEVHMLSKGAFNALLKILEEPPEHVKFILATTETHKVPETIISRCQRYDFKRINDLELVNRLKYIAKSEGVEVDEKSYNYILKNSAGGLRNAISLFEQLITDNKIIFEEVISKLEIIGEEEINNFLEKLLSKDAGVIDDLDKIIVDGKNIKLFFKELLFFTKDKALEKVKNKQDISELLNILEVLDKTYADTKNSLDENTTFIIGVLKILNGFVAQQPSEEKNNIGVSRVKKEEIKKTVEHKQKIVEKETPILKETGEELNGDDIADIFGEVEEKKVEVNEKNQNIENSGFNVGDYIKNLKEAGAKGALTMALRGSDLSLGAKSLNIKPKTKITRVNVENVDNISLMTSVLNKLGYGDYTVNIL